MRLLWVSKSLLTLCCVITVFVCVGVQAAPSKFNSKAPNAVLLDYNTGQVLFDKNAYESMAPSSMTKLMTLYILFDKIEKGIYSLEDRFLVSEKAWKKGGSKMFVKVGTEVSIEDLIRGIIVQSGNDACIVVAEGISGSEEAFAEEMNYYAKELNLKNSNFKNSTGWPDDEHFMSAYDLGLLSVKLIGHFRKFYPYFKEEVFTYNGIKQYNRNTLVRKKSTGVDGLKTGHTEAGGYGIAISALEKTRRLVAVVNGLDSEKEREDEAMRLVRHGFRDFEHIIFFLADEVIEEAEVWLGKAETVPLVSDKNLIMSLSRWEKEGLKVEVTYDGPVPAPVVKGSEIGKIAIIVDGNVRKELPLYAGKDVHEISFFSRVWQGLKYYISGS